MAKKVLKFGGTSVGTIERILHVAKIIKKEYAAGNEVIAVVSAMSGKTNELIKQSRLNITLDEGQFKPSISKIENWWDYFLGSTQEQALKARLKALGGKRSLIFQKVVISIL